MTPEEHRILLEIREATLQNSRDIESIKKANKIAVVMKAIYWLIIIGISFGAFYFLQPYIDSIKEAYGAIGL